MLEWWDALTGLEIFFALVAIPSTLLLIIQTVLMLFGMGSHHGADAELETDHSGFDHDDSPDFDSDDYEDGDYHDPGLRIFTVRGLIAFFCIFGWCGLSCLQSDIPLSAVLTIAFIAGLASMLSIALLLKAALKLQIDGTTNLLNAVGKSASVYIRVPAGRAECGKVNLTVQERFIEADAVTDEESDLSPGLEVTVVGMVNQNTLLVSAKK